MSAFTNNYPATGLRGALIMPAFLSVSSFWTNLVTVIKTFPSHLFNNLVDIIAVAFIVYYGMRLVRETRALQLVKSMVVIVVVYFMANALSMISVKFFLGKILDAGLVFLVILFQPELRRALEQIGRSKLTDIGKLGAGTAGQKRIENMIEAICEASGKLSEAKTGALMVIEREIKLGDITATGTLIDSEPSSELLGNIFFPNSPLHDGALVIRDDRLYSAGCFLPLSGSPSVSRDLGTRHRAAIGMSEVSDAIVVIVSEETGTISVALEGHLHRGLSVKNLSMFLRARLLRSSEEKKRRYFGRSKEREQ